jgi:hypothetical protein
MLLAAILLLQQLAAANIIKAVVSLRSIEVSSSCFNYNRMKKYIPLLPDQQR